MYHYVRPAVEAPPNYYHLGLADFRRQLDYFETEYGFVDRETFLAAMRGERPVPESGVVLTFDDGLVDHYEWVLPELRERGLWGIFYVPTAPLRDQSVLDVHRIHTLLGEYGGEVVYDTLEPLVTDGMIPDQKRADFREETYTRQENTEKTTLVKRILNYYVAYDHRSELLDGLVERLPAADTSWDRLYMTADQLRELQEAGNIVGSHSISHRVFSKLDRATQEREIASSFADIEAAVDGVDVRTFCYPYGGFHTFTDETVAILNGERCRFSFNVESREISQEDVDETPQALPRYDCNEFEHGEASGSLG
jgi:peptidoglycan/xylan/chitin deacetylase (PgdA/CDA1 family)